MLSLLANFAMHAAVPSMSELYSCTADLLQPVAAFAADPDMCLEPVMLASVFTRTCNVYCPGFNAGVFFGRQFASQQL